MEKHDLAISGIILTGVIVIAFITGVHNIDNAWNMRVVQLETGFDITDCTVAGLCMSPATAYNSGLTLVFASFFAMICFGVLVGFEIGRWK